MIQCLRRYNKISIHQVHHIQIRLTLSRRQCKKVCSAFTSTNFRTHSVYNGRDYFFSNSQKIYLTIGYWMRFEIYRSKNVAAIPPLTACTSTYTEIIDFCKKLGATEYPSLLSRVMLSERIEIYSSRSKFRRGTSISN